MKFAWWLDGWHSGRKLPQNAFYWMKNASISKKHHSSMFMYRVYEHSMTRCWPTKTYHQELGTWRPLFFLCFMTLRVLTDYVLWSSFDDTSWVQSCFLPPIIIQYLKHHTKTQTDSTHIINISISYKHLNHRKWNSQYQLQFFQHYVSFSKSVLSYHHRWVDWTTKSKTSSQHT